RHARGEAELPVLPVLRPARRLTAAFLIRPGSDGIAGGFGVIGAAGRSGPPERPVGKLVYLPLGVLLEAMIMTALRAGVTQARPPARLVRDVVLQVALGSGPPADGTRAARVPDLGQVP